MKLFIMLLRGINVGGKNTLPMKELAAILQQLGCDQVKTFIQSGNVVFRCNENPAEQTAQAIEKQFGFKPDILVLEKDEFVSAVDNNPYPADAGKSVHFYFAFAAAEPDYDKLDSLAAKSEHYKLIGRVFYLYAPDGIGRSRLAARIEHCLGVAVTARNLNTLNKLLAMLDE